MITPKHRSLLKWAGGKKKLVSDIHHLLPKRQRTRLIEPFVGGGSVFLNLDFDEYLLMDTNADLINLFNIIKTDCTQFINRAQRLFTPSNNTPETYYALRQVFNNSSEPMERASLFLYLNRHGYNGLCRYNKSGGYNVPFGRYKKPYFPEDEIVFFAKKAQRATFIQGDFAEAFAHAKTTDMIYCDPPYAPVKQISNFTAYAGNHFGPEEQKRLVTATENVVSQGTVVLISNHDVPFTREIYQRANKIHKLSVHRSISRKGQERVKVGELMALYKKKRST